MTAPRRLPGKRVLITGASSGIGMEAARLFAAEGARLALLARGEEALEQAARELQRDAVVLPADLTDRAGVESAIEHAVAELGGLDVLVSNAAAGAFGHFLELDADDFDRVLAITFGGAVNVIRAALPHLRASRGVIVATLSLLSRTPMPSWSSYVAAKHALRGFLNSLRIEEQEQRTGVRVAMVHPGIVDTPFWSYASSATGRKPRVVPDAYAAGAIAAALVDAAVRPRREFLVGGGTRAFDQTFVFARGAAERMLVVFDRWLHSGDQRAVYPGSLWHPTECPQVEAGIPSRESVLASSGGDGAPRRVRATVRLARHLGASARKAFELQPALSRPLRERQRSVRAGKARAPHEPAST
ncbi:MAG TPA: SDR family NAD(P)-dependent oxidoreductase [Thermoleophilaceae bacterium]|nr:SDR family NAD(P)-dependent oxidoreductase [Thermoleophilaceae bacterium]